MKKCFVSSSNDFIICSWGHWDFSDGNYIGLLQNVSKFLKVVSIVFLKIQLSKLDCVSYSHTGIG